MSKRRRQPTPKRRRWDPLVRVPVTGQDVYAAHGMSAPDAVYGNDTYSVFVREMGHGSLHLSFHRRDRSAIIDWRHMQAIKNEVAGPESFAVEIFPPESNLVDSSNERHLWVAPPNAKRRKEWLQLLPQLLGQERFVLAPEDLEEHLGGPTKARQRAWEEGIPTGLGTGLDRIAP